MSKAFSELYPPQLVQLGDYAGEFQALQLSVYEVLWLTSCLPYVGPRFENLVLTKSWSVNLA